jgi:molybdopterin/thiamine biosynthesis adenylyltransferase
MKDQNYSLEFDRISYLLNPEIFSDKRITVVGLGSGGTPACDHLVMNGIRIWELYDPDTLASENLVKHPRMRKDLGRLKVDIQKEWIEDRNPNVEVKTFAEDVMQSPNFIESVRRSDLVLSCSDKKSVREFVSDQCVAAKVPFVTASVFRTGIGGEIFGYIPSQTGCYKCLQLFSELNQLDLSDDALGLTEDEESRIYGLDEKEFRASGLSIDIQMIALIQVRMALSILLRESTQSMATLKSNWIVYANRPAPGIFRSHFEAKQMLLKPQKVCYCTTSNHQLED